MNKSHLCMLNMWHRNLISSLYSPDTKHKFGLLMSHSIRAIYVTVRLWLLYIAASEWIQCKTEKANKSEKRAKKKKKKNNKYHPKSSIENEKPTVHTTMFQLDDDDDNDKIKVRTFAVVLIEQYFFVLVFQIVVISSVWYDCFGCWPWYFRLFSC